MDSAMQGTLTEGKGTVLLTSMYKLVLICSFWFSKHYLLFYKGPNIMRRSAVQSLPHELVFLALRYFNIESLKDIKGSFSKPFLRSLSRL